MVSPGMLSGYGTLALLVYMVALLISLAVGEAISVGRSVYCFSFPTGFLIVSCSSYIISSFANFSAAVLRSPTYFRLSALMFFTSLNKAKTTIEAEYEFIIFCGLASAAYNHICSKSWH